VNSKSQVSVDKLRVTTVEAAELLDVTPRWIRELAKRGLIKKLATDRYLLAEVLQGYARSLEHDERQTRQSKSAQRVFDAKAEELENQIARELDHLMEADQFASILTEIEQTVEQELGPLANEIVDPDAQAALAKHLDHALRQLKTSYADARQSLAAGKGVPSVEE
jgi:DNA-binding transcriptional MerR regulator